MDSDAFTLLQHSTLRGRAVFALTLAERAFERLPMNHWMATSFRKIAVAMLRSFLSELPSGLAVYSLLEDESRGTTVFEACESFEGTSASAAAYQVILTAVIYVAWLAYKRDGVTTNLPEPVNEINDELALGLLSTYAEECRIVSKDELYSIAAKIHQQHVAAIPDELGKEVTMA